MKIAFTADNHLKADTESLSQYRALKDIVGQTLDADIKILVIVGDLFDRKFSTYEEFEKFCLKYKNQGLEFHIIPGNHDSGLRRGVFAADNITVYENTKLVHFEDTGMPVLFVPYSEGKTIGEEITPFKDRIEPGGWVLAAHGDWLGSATVTNPEEPGIYMPLTKKDMTVFRPARAVLGHVHKPLDIENLHYCGSPLGLDITETGKRRFLTLDLRNNNLESLTVKTDAIFFNPVLYVYPMENETLFLENQISEIIGGWNLTEEEIKKTKIRIKITGYTSDKKALSEVIENSFRNFKNIDGGIDMSGVYIADNYELNEISKMVIDRVENFKPGSELPAKDQIVLSALKAIYGG
jgi:exonuclease SbcD